MKHLLSKKMNVLVALALVLSLVLGLAPAAFATADESDKLVDNIYGKNKQNIKDYIYDAVYGYAVEYGAFETAIAKIDQVIEMVESYKAQIPEVPDEVPEVLPEDWPEEIPEEVWDELPELLDQIPPEMIEELPPEMIKSIPPEVIEQIPSDVLDKVPDSVLDQIPQDTIDQLPEDLRNEIMNRLGRTEIPQMPVVYDLRSRAASQDNSDTTNTYSEYVKYINQLKQECDELLDLLNELKADLEGDDLTTWDGFVDTLHYYEEELPERIERIKYLWAVIASYVIDGVPFYDETTEAEQVKDDFINAIESLVEIEATINDEIVPAMEDAFDAIAEIAFAPTCTLLEVFLDHNVDTAEDVVDAFEEIAAMSDEEIEARINELVDEATHADYLIDEESYYVAFGNIVARDSYAELLAAELDVAFVNKSADGMTIEKFAENVASYKTEIEKADLITLNFGEIDTFVDVLNNVATSNADYDIDWVKYLGQDYAKVEEKIDEAMDAIYAELAANAIDAELAEAFVAAVEVYAYNCVVHGVNLNKAVAEIKKINSDALIVVVGAYNPLSDATYDYKGTVIELGSYVDYLFEAFCAYDLVYAIVTADITYVDAPNVDVMFDETELSTEMLAKIAANKLLPSGAGHKYIQEQIYNALNITRDENILPPPPTGDITASVAVLTVLMGVGVVALISKRNSFM